MTARSFGWRFARVEFLSGDDRFRWRGHEIRCVWIWESSLPIVAGEVLVYLKDLRYRFSLAQWAPCIWKYFNFSWSIFWEILAWDHLWLHWHAFWRFNIWISPPRKEFLRVRPALCRISSFDIFLYLLPVLVKEPEAFEKPVMLNFWPPSLMPLWFIFVVREISDFAGRALEGMSSL